MTTKAELLKAARAKCLDCCCYQQSEVKACVSHTCALWPFRLGRDPSPSRRSAVKNLAPVEGNFRKETGKAAHHG